MTLQNHGYSLCADEELSAQGYSSFLFAFTNMGEEIARIAPMSHQLTAVFSREQIDEINSHLRSYTEKILLIEESGRLWGIIPSLYPSSTICIALLFDDLLISGEDTLALAGKEAYKELFVISPSVIMRQSRMSNRLALLETRFARFCGQISACFLDMDALKDADIEGARDEIFSRIAAISELVGCQIDCAEESTGDYRRTDLPLLVAFLFSILSAAKDNAPLRRASLLLTSSSSSLRITVRFETQSSITLSPVLMEWESIGAEKNMPFEYSSDGQTVSVGFQPIRRDWSYLGLKQNTKFI